MMKLLYVNCYNGAIFVPERYDNSNMDGQQARTKRDANDDLALIDHPLDVCSGFKNRT